MGEIHELFILALSLVWFAGATPEENWRLPMTVSDFFFADLITMSMSMTDTDFNFLEFEWKQLCYARYGDLR